MSAVCCYSLQGLEFLVYNVRYVCVWNSPCWSCLHLKDLYHTYLFIAVCDFLVVFVGNWWGRKSWNGQNNNIKEIPTSFVSVLSNCKEPPYGSVQNKRKIKICSLHVTRYYSSRWLLLLSGILYIEKIYVCGYQEFSDAIHVHSPSLNGRNLR